VRVVVAVVAVLVIGWLGVQQRDTVLEQRGVELSGRLSEPGNAARADRAYRDAGLLNPDTTPDVGRAFVFLAGERRGEAKALLEEVLRREPDNLTAWGVLYNVSRENDPATARRALAARARLDPLSAQRR
jgi:cytochrome c-type biogenesis protein CcmH/NrfG